MQVLILSCNTGEGHNSCAKAIQEFYKEQNDVCVIYDALLFISKGISKTVSTCFTGIYRHFPNLFRYGYKYSENHPALFEKKSFIYKLLTVGSKRMYEYISSKNYDLVICTHTFAAVMLTDMLAKYPMDIKTAFVATDYTCYPATKETDMDYYFIPDTALSAEYEKASIFRPKIIAGGIPVRQMFYKQIPKEEAKKQYNIPSDKKHLLVMGGSMGCGPIKKMTKEIIDSLDENYHVTVVCGTNKRLYNKIKKQNKTHANVHVKGFVTDMAQLMDSADLYLTKPGGISVTEAAIKELPTVLMNTVAGCEEYNRKYFVNLGSSVTDTVGKSLSEICIDVLTNEEKLRKMAEPLKMREKSNSSEIIYKCMKGEYTENCDTRYENQI